MNHVCPDTEEHRPFEDEFVAPLGLAQSVQQAFDHEMRYQELKVLARLSCAIQQSIPHRRGQIARLVFHHASDSKYGRMTLPIRRAWATE